MTKKFDVEISQLLDAGVHFGHKTSRWNPRMASYIYGEKDGVHIIDLQTTAALMKFALTKIYETVKNNGKILFVGSKVQATELIAEYAERCGQFYVNNRWLGGTLTNWSTISKSIKKLDEIEKNIADAEVMSAFTKKEALDLERSQKRLLNSLAGIRKIGGRPDLLVIIDTNKEHLAISEAKKLGIPIIAIVDTNSNPDDIDYPVPGNDDAIRSIRLYCHLFAEAALAGIEDSLVNAGVDVGATKQDVGAKDKDLSGVKKMDKPARVSKTPGASDRSANDKPAVARKPRPKKTEG
jgi:small subunit ribosomal protein S2